MDLSDNTPDEKKALFERFLTYRRRIARMCSVQAIYLFDIKHKANLIKIPIIKVKEEINIICRSVLYFYKHIFFSNQDYGKNRKNKRIDEKHFEAIVDWVIKDLEKIDNIVSQYLNEKWTVERLDTVIRAILRCAVCEILYQPNTEIAIITSEYTNIAGHFFNGKEIGFINGIVDKIGKNQRSNEA